MKSIEVSAISFLIFLFLAVTTMQYFKIEPNQPLLAAILLALNVQASKGSDNGKPA